MRRKFAPMLGLALLAALFSSAVALGVQSPVNPVKLTLAQSRAKIVSELDAKAQAGWHLTPVAQALVGGASLSTITSMLPAGSSLGVIRLATRGPQTSAPAVTVGIPDSFKVHKRTSGSAVANLYCWTNSAGYALFVTPNGAYHGTARLQNYLTLQNSYASTGDVTCYYNESPCLDLGVAVGRQPWRVMSITLTGNNNPSLRSMWCSSL